MRNTHKINRYILTLALGSFSLAANAADTVATVNGTKITQKQYEQIVETLKAKNPQFEAEGNKQAIVNELVSRELLYQEAKKQKVDKDPKVAFLLEQQRIELMIQALIQKTLSKDPVDEKEVKKIYKEKVAGANMQEYKARHILLKTEDEAKTIIAKLDAGEDFITMAKEKSTGPSAKDGGDLGWFPPSRMVPPFARAVAEMKKDTYSKTPVQTQFGWHVIKLEDSRKMEPPKYDDVKQQIAGSLNKKRVQALVEKLRSSAKIKID